MLHFAFLLVLLCFSSASSNDVRPLAYRQVLMDLQGMTKEPNEVWNLLFGFDEGLFVLVNLIDFKFEVITKVFVCLCRKGIYELMVESSSTTMALI